MENDILDSLEDLGYSGPLLEEDNFNAAIEQGPRSPDYTQLVSWLTESIRLFCGVEEQVNAITNPDDSGNFMLELSGFMREYGCPYKVLSDGPVSQRLNTRESKLQLLDFLTTELASVKMLSLSKPASLKVTDPSAKPSDDAESEVAKHLKMMLIALGFPKPPANITTFQLFSKVESKVKEIVTKDPSLIGKSLLKVRLSDKQWEQVLKINDSLLKDYQTRREMLLKRLDVTIQSFLWSDTAKQKQDKIAEIYQPLRKALTAKCNVGVGRILSARDDLTRIEKTSSGDGRVKCALNRVLIPKVPDRGGRAWEHEPPPPEMPAFQKRDASQQQRPQSGRGGGGGGRGGGKVQGGWGDSSGGNVGGQWSQGGGGHRGGGQGHNPSYSQGGGYQGGGGGRGGGYHQGGGGYQGGGGGYQGGGGGYQQGGGGYQGGGGGYQQGGGGHNQGGYQDYNQDRRGGGRGGSARGRGRGGRGGR